MLGRGYRLRVRKQRKHKARGVQTFFQEFVLLITLPLPCHIQRATLSALAGKRFLECLRRLPRCILAGTTVVTSGVRETLFTESAAP